MKLKITVSLLVLLFPIAWAVAAYPEKLNEQNQFVTQGDFQNVYRKIYLDANQEDLVEVCQRVRQYPSLASVFTDKDCRSLSGSSLSQFVSIILKSKYNFSATQAEFSKRFAFEQSMLRLENNLKRRNSLASIFSNGDKGEEEKDSPFDLVSDLNTIDELFFGEKHEKPSPEFLNLRDAKVSEDFLSGSDNKEKWQDQREENHPSKSDFEKGNKSLAGMVEFMDKDIFIKELNTRSQVATEMGKNIFHYYQATAPFSSGKGEFQVDSDDTPTFSTDKPEVDTVGGLAMADELSSLQKNFFWEKNCAEEQRRSDVARDTVTQSLDDCALKRSNDFALAMEQFHQDTELAIQSSRYDRFLKGLDMFNVCLEMFQNALPKLIENFKNLAEKPKL